MLGELGKLLALFVVATHDPARKEREAAARYALLFEQAQRCGWQVVRDQVPRKVVLKQDIYRVQVDGVDYVVSTEDGDTLLLGLLQKDYVNTALKLLVESKVG